jgi:DNA-binding transcriptional MerR regulator
VRVAQLARHAGVTADTVRHYARVGLLRPHRDPANGYRDFDQSDLSRLQFIRNARALGFSVDEIRAILARADHGESPCAHVRRLAADHLDEIRVRLRDLKQVERRLRKALELWDQVPDAAPDSSHVCVLIESWAHANEGHVNEKSR